MSIRSAHTQYVNVMKQLGEPESLYLHSRMGAHAQSLLPNTIRIDKMDPQQTVDLRALEVLVQSMCMSQMASIVLYCIVLYSIVLDHLLLLTVVDLLS